jgi:hypothetical protein
MPSNALNNNCKVGEKYFSEGQNIKPDQEILSDSA